VLSANFNLRSGLKFEMPASVVGSRLGRVAVLVSPPREGKQCEVVLYETSENPWRESSAVKPLLQEKWISKTQLGDVALLSTVLAAVQRSVKEEFGVLRQPIPIGRSGGFGAGLPHALLL